MLIITSYSPKLMHSRKFNSFNVVIVDVLRACSTIIVILSKSVKDVIPLGDPNQCGHNLPSIGEKDGNKIEGFQWGNSPYELAVSNLNYKRMGIVTSGATSAIIKLGKNHNYLLCGSTLNYSSIAKAMVGIGGNWALLGATANFTFHLEDKIGCALIARDYYKYFNIKPSFKHKMFIENYCYNIRENISNSDNAKYLEKIGNKADIEFIISQTNKFKIVPFYNYRLNVISNLVK